MRILTTAIVAAAISLPLVAPAQAHEEKTHLMTVSHPWTRATAPTQKAGAVFMQISTATSTADRLIGAVSPDAESAQLHNLVQDGDVLRMRAVDGIDIPADGEAVLAPGGFHIMLIGLKAPLFEETIIPLTLTFEKAGEMEIEAVVEAAGARGATGATNARAGSHAGHGK